MSSFYKLLVTPDFDSQLRLPPQFVKDHAEILPKKATIRIESGESWIVKIERVGQHRFFTEGWEKFSRDVDLEFKQFMLFWFDGESGFRVSVYGMSGCERELSVLNTRGGSENSEHGDGQEDFTAKSESGDEDDANIDEERGFRARKQWRFRAELKKHHETELEVPGDFAKGTGIAENGRIFLLTHPKSKKWPVFVTTRRHDKDQSFAMTVGWNDFLVGSKMRIGSMILFEFLSNKDNIIIEAKVVKDGKKGLFSPKKRRGRPPNFSKF
ncbi:B3 domain-containing protein REM9-like [Primulina eburnea]|uniref:B3 domain-containing protein REM9-like n=1 Tax=Primulina eburnea TaxID=1245227 RepID=UPI003C6C8829